MMNSNIFIAIFIYLGNSFANVFSGVLSKFAVLKLESFAIPVYSLLFLRAFISIVILSPFFIKNIKYINKSLKFNIIISTLTALDVFLFNIGLKGTPINQAIIIMFLIPVWINLFSNILLKEEATNIQNIIILICCFIALFISNPELNPYNIIHNYRNRLSDSFNFYPILIFLNTFCVTFALLLQKKFSGDRPIMFGLFSNNIILLLLSLFFMKGIISYLNIYTILMAFALSILDIMEFGCAYKAYQMCKVSILQPVRFIRIVFSAAFGYVLLGEKTTAPQIIGMLIIVLMNFINPILNSLDKKNK